MSSTIDNITCPKCGGNAQRETDHKTGEVYDHCTVCDYEEVITEAETMDEYNKITAGFVTQTYQKQGNKFICTKQEFTAGDPVDRENEQGEPVDVDVREEQYQPFDMVQPSKDEKMKIRWLDNVDLAVVNKYDEENDVVEDEGFEIVEKGEINNVDFLEDKGDTIDIQFGNGSVAFNVKKKWFETVD